MRVNRKPNFKQMVKEASATKKALIKKLPESVKRNLKEDIFDDMITPGIEVLDMLDKVKAENPNLSTPEFEDLISDIEPAALPKEADLDPETGVENAVDIVETFKQGKKVLKEASAYEQAVRDYVAQVGIENAGTYNDYVDWCETSDPVIAPIPAQNFRKFLNRIKAETPVEPGPEPEPYEMSAGLSSLVQALDDGEEVISDAATTVDEKYKTIELKLKRVTTGRSMKNYYLLFGDAGIGKSKIVEKCLQKTGYENVPVLTGDIGKSRSDVARFLWKYKDTELVVLDDCDSMINKRGADPSVANMLKGAMDPDRHTVTISPTVQKLLNKTARGEEGEGPAHQRSGVYKVLRDGELLCSADGEIIFMDPADSEAEEVPPMTFSSKNEAIEFCKEDKQEGSVYEVVDQTGVSVMMYDADADSVSEDGEEIDTSADIPQTWRFNARVIFISNLDTPDINPAVISRCDYYCLHLTQEEYMVRLGQIINDMVIDADGRTGWSDADIREAKAFTVSLMASVIEAANHGVKIFNKPVVLTHPLEFRIVRDLVEGQLMLIEDYMEEHPEADKKTARQATLKSFIRICLLPKL